MDKTLLIGVDGAEFAILDAMIADGHMPCLKRIIDEGVRAELLSTPHPLTPPAWTTLTTGRTPGNHGVFDFIWAEPRGDTVYFTLNNFRDIRVETVWSMVSRQGGRIVSLNFPLMSPPPALDGAIIPGLVSWKHLRRNVHPPDLYGRLKHLPHFDPRTIAWDFEREKKTTKHIPQDQVEEWVTYHVRRERQWFEVFHLLAASERADLIGILLDGTDKLQHICWKHLDPARSPAMSDPLDLRIRRLCQQYFRDLDGFLGHVLEAAGDGGRVFLASDHGFGPTEKVFRVNKWLERQGLLKFAPTQHLSSSEMKKVDRLTSDHFVHLDWKATRAYAQSAATNGIDIRLSTAPGDGGVPAPDYARFREKLIADLLAVRDPQTREPVVRQVLRREEVFAGKYNQRCPDLTLVLNDFGFVSTLDAEPIVASRPVVAGTHRPAGVFLAWGAGIARGRRLPRQSIVDITPTLLHSLGLPVPQDLDGRVIADAFDREFLAARPVRTGEPTRPPDSRGKTCRPPSAEEQEIILGRLRALGYVE